MQIPSKQKESVVKLSSSHVNYTANWQKRRSLVPNSPISLQNPQWASPSWWVVLSFVTGIPLQKHETFENKHIAHLWTGCLLHWNGPKFGEYYIWKRGHKYPYIITAAGCHSKYSDLLGNYFWDGKNISNSLSISRFLQNSSGYSS